MGLMSVPDRDSLEIRSLIIAGEILGVEATAIRVAAARLQKEGLLASVERGVYSLGPDAVAVTRQLQGWKSVRSRTREWEGDWLLIMTQHLGRTKKAALRRRERVMRLNGYASPMTGLWVRPANLVDSMSTHKSKLLAIGLDPDAVMILASAVDSQVEQSWRTLWPIDTLARSYEDARQRMAKSIKRLPGLSAKEAARETFLVGQSVIPIINTDPLLPAPIADRTLFNKMVEDMIVYYETGTPYWLAYG